MVLESTVFVKVLPGVLTSVMLGMTVGLGVASMWNSKFKKNLKDMEKYRNKNNQDHQK